jgi:hypothetical protein
MVRYSFSTSEHSVSATSLLMPARHFSRSVAFSCCTRSGLLARPMATSDANINIRYKNRCKCTSREFCVCRGGFRALGAEIRTDGHEELTLHKLVIISGNQVVEAKLM